MTKMLARLIPGAVVAAVVEEAARTLWHSDMAFEGVPTGDGRFMVDGSLGWRDLPLTLMAMIETTAGGHLGAQVAGRIDTIERRREDMNGARLPDGVNSLYATGVFDTGEYGNEIERMVDDQTLRGISVDLAVHEWAFRDPETGELIDPETATDEQWDRAFMGELEFAVTDGEIMASTVCPTPAFADARIAIVAAAWSPFARHTWTAGVEYAEQHGIEAGQLMTTIQVDMRVTGRDPGMVASGAPAPTPGLAPLAPPREWFYRPEPDAETPITITDAGEIYGHIALWRSCHTGYVSGQWAQCVTPPRSRAGYADFHLGVLRTEEGDDVPVGTITIGTDHASMNAGRAAARAHYDHTGTAAAYVRAIDGKHGIWISGATRSDLRPEQLRDLRAHPPSGDWRDSEGHLELQGVLAVVVPGYPVRRSQAALAADASGGVRVVSLILASGVGVDETPASPVGVDATILAAAIDGPDALDELIQDDGCGCAG